MSAPFIIPFNYQPLSNVVKQTSGITVPGTEYALVEVLNPAGFTIDGVSPFLTRTVSLSSVNGVAQNKTFTPSDGYMGYTGTYTRNADGGGISCSGSVSDTSETIESFSKTGSQSGTYSLTGAVTNMSTLTFTLNSTSGVANGALTLTATVFMANRNQFWVKPGTVIVGTSYLTTAYAAIV